MPEEKRLKKQLGKEKKDWARNRENPAIPLGAFFALFSAGLSISHRQAVTPYAGTWHYAILCKQH